METKLQNVRKKILSYIIQLSFVLVILLFPEKKKKKNNAKYNCMAQVIVLASELLVFSQFYIRKDDSF